MSWPIWWQKLLRDVLTAVLPVLIAVFVSLQDDPKAPIWAVFIAAGALVGLRAAQNWWKHQG